MTPPPDPRAQPAWRTRRPSLELQPAPPTPRRKSGTLAVRLASDGPSPTERASAQRLQRFLWKKGVAGAAREPRTPPAVQSVAQDASAARLALQLERRASAVREKRRRRGQTRGAGVVWAEDAPESPPKKIGRRPLPKQRTRGAGVLWSDDGDASPARRDGRRKFSNQPAAAASVSHAHLGAPCADAEEETARNAARHARRARRGAELGSPRAIARIRAPDAAPSRVRRRRGAVARETPPRRRRARSYRCGPGVSPETLRPGRIQNFATVGSQTRGLRGPTDPIASRR